tara:strand:- start:253 stop:795 length:543 start_codon:yes stop_codon:yes gene_type:complete
MKNLLLKFLGPLLAIAGVLGLTGSSILWNFQGRTLGLPATVLSLLILAVGVVLLRPLQPAATSEASEIIKTKISQVQTTVSKGNRLETDGPLNEESVEVNSKGSEVELDGSLETKKPSLTTAEAIAAELAAAEAEKPELVLMNFAPDALRPGNSIRFNKRVPGRNLSGFRNMASDLFKTN